MKVTCPECNQEYEVDESMRGLTVYCTAAGCDGVIAIPKKRNSTQRFSMGKTVSSGRSIDPEGYEVYEKMQKTCGAQKITIVFCIITFLFCLLFNACAEKYEKGAKELEYALDDRAWRESQCNSYKTVYDMSESFPRDERQEAIESYKRARKKLEEENQKVKELRAKYGTLNECKNSAKLYNILLLLMRIAHVVCWLILACLHWSFIHCGWRLVPEDKAVTTPNMAVLLNLVPGLMPFWNWVTYFELGRHYSELTGRRGNKVLALIMSVMTTLGGTGIFTAWLAWGEKVWKLKHLWGVPSFLIAWFAMVLVMQGELLRSAEIIVKEKDFDD